MAYKKVFICEESNAELSYNVNNDGNLFIEMVDPTEDIAVCNWIVLHKEDISVLIEDLQRIINDMQ